MLNNLLVYRLAIFNILCLAALSWAWQRGFVSDMFGNDRSYMTYAAAGLFMAGSVSCLARAAKVGSILNSLKLGGHPQVSAVKFEAKAAHLDDVGDLIVTVGLTGTAIGVVMMLHSFSAGSLSDPAKIVETATALGDGVGTAFRSTIVSAIAWCWHLDNLRMLKTATTLMLEDAN